MTEDAPKGQWYKWEIHYGPGHQSRTIKYRWYHADCQYPTLPIGKDMEQEIGEQVFSRILSYTGSAYWTATPIAALPEKVLKAMIRDTKENLADTRRWLKTLQAMPFEKEDDHDERPE